MNIDQLVKLTARAWSLDILAAMSDGTPGRQAQLLTTTGASRNAFAQSMAHLVSLGLVERNPGHGHPLRPEFRLTPAGQAAGQAASRVKSLLPDPTDARLIRRVWSLPILAVSKTPRHFASLRQHLHPITDRALSQSLHHLQARDWIVRDIDPDQTPLRPLYCASSTGRAMAEALEIAV
ncbi:winged helix-turn-helix transcriptional regulator [Yoonia sp. R2331]|uniref:winged helix-turn-helix transcriptional regulator n=1 Tax=Yoonia sp. R2331 TaxID=3237238 RepID=UPI0034E57E20